MKVDYSLDQLLAVVEKLDLAKEDTLDGVPCPVCGIEREWHFYGQFSYGRVWIDGIGEIDCTAIKKRRIWISGS